MSRYEFPAMDAKSKSDPAAWKACIDQARMLIEYQHTRLLNLDLLAKHGPAAWRLNAEIVAHLHTQLTNLLNEAQDEIQEVNRERKDQQTKLYNKLYELESTWYSLVGKNMQLEQECSRLQTELARREEETEQQ
ncbi:hypothetical protein CAOG_009255 [Capsaspora owczarzaki ATCC 30864]|nr:hypothetical protein CAOG_009255 [Capsaspora owczarzaki ATCC 30864]